MDDYQYEIINEFTVEGLENKLLFGRFTSSYDFLCIIIDGKIYFTQLIAKNIHLSENNAVIRTSYTHAPNPYNADMADYCYINFTILLENQPLIPIMLLLSCYKTDKNNNISHILKKIYEDYYTDSYVLK